MINDDGMVVCDRCGQLLNVGDYPYCPHAAGHPAVARDEIPGGIVVENYGPQPMRFDSHSERRRYMAEQGLQEREKFSPMPGSDKDPAGIPNPAGYMDPQTLLNAAELICRNGRAEAPFDPVASGVIRGEFGGHLTGRDASAVAEGDARRSARVGRRIGGQADNGR